MSPRPDLVIKLAPFVFVLIWSTGWISAKYVVPHADPFWFLTLRFAAAGLLIALFALAVRAPWPTSRSGWLHAIFAGVLLHGLYLGGVWWAVKQGVPAGISGLLAALQPLVTIVLAPMILNERISPLQWAGAALGFAGVMLVISPKLALGGATGIGWVPLAINICSTLALTAGSFYQKRYVSGGDLRTVTALQYVGAVLVVGPIALLTEELRFDGSAEAWAVLAWSIIVLSIIAIGLMLMMINRGQVSRVSALNYLIPTVVAVQAFAMFGETLNGVQIVGMVLTAMGVYLTMKRS